MTKRNFPLLAAILFGFVVGILWLGAIRFFTFRSDTVHYHANFGLYIDGRRDEFRNFTFYEEVQSCGSTEKDNPKARVHMHDNKNAVIHVHESGVTWGAFFANLGYTLGNNLIKTDTGVYIDGQDGNELRFILNGQEVEGVANRIVGNKDRLLISYGTEDDAVLRKYYDAVPKDAAEYNSKNDPGSCSGGHKLTLKDRLVHAVGIDN